MASNRAQILISAVDQTKTAFDSIKRGLGGLTDTAKSVNGVLANLGVGVSLAGIGAMIKSSIDSEGESFSVVNGGAARAEVFSDSIGTSMHQGANAGDRR